MQEPWIGKRQELENKLSAKHVRINIFFFLKKYSHISMGQGIIVSVTFQGKNILHVDERTFYLNTRAEDFLLSALADIDVSVNEIECITNDNRLTILFK